jgi:AraC-like DNA-binding protein
MDPLSDVIALLRPHAAISKPITGRGAWGVRYAAYDLPGFALVLEGRCWLALDGEEPICLDRGDFVLLPATPAFTLSSEPHVPCIPVEPSEVAVRHGEQDGAPDLRMLGGSFRIERANAPLLVALLPELILLRAAEGETSRLARVIELVAEECADERPGGDTVLRRLLDVLLIEALRRDRAAGEHFQPGLLVGLHQPGLASALRAVHADVGGRWTVAGLAGIAGMSRSAFAARFLETVGCAPIEYVARWRIALAKDALAQGGKGLDRLAGEIGYESASAFSTAFRRRVGCSPGAFARTLRA